MLIREQTDHDADTVRGLRKVAFGDTAEGNPLRPGRRGLVAELDGRPAGALTIHEFHQYHGGAPVPMGGIGGVAVDPYARGRGVATGLLDRVLADLREHGQPLSALYATVPALYRSRGWERAGVFERLDLTLDRVATGPRLAARPAVADDLPGIHACYNDVAGTVNGLLDRSAPAIDLAEVLDLDVVSVVPGHDGEVRGYLTAERDREGLRVLDLIGRDVETQLGLLGGLRSWSGLLDQLTLRVVDPAVTGLLTNQGIRYTTHTSQWLLRVVDLPAAVAARGWPAARWLKPAAVDLEVHDEHAPWHAGRQRLVVEDGAVRVEPGGSGAVRLRARALGPWFSGMQDSHALRRAGLLDGDAALLDRLTGAPGVPRLADFF
ncbi:GNAT family N-acetyltransferase [Actinosynnema sp. NPDC047251]|uniref:N-acetyltransferase n=1 Tax=Saccharothrix espanaensis (strain ATCC 51144 / DSM 44229 / JCM 9112 / NBRC 15066 / NRRL 15764) TaxID=1179773 RepID=K0JQN5_SACES|nr:GNAT family N-acetyltransferase [Saccharothrix espanaensis]CCH27986.1 N-acetyltransferase [Saccharothrix espanaensis DSM 44229]